MKTLSKKLIETGSFNRGETINIPMISRFMRETAKTNKQVKVINVKPGEVSVIHTVRGGKTIHKEDYSLKNGEVKLCLNHIPKYHKDYAKYFKMLEINN